MKVHIAYDDGTLVGVYRKRKDAKRALDDVAIDRGGRKFGKWNVCSGGLERPVTRHPHRYTWEQWIDTHGVTK